MFILLLYIQIKVIRSSVNFQIVLATVKQNNLLKKEQQYTASMQAYSFINNILTKPNSTFEEFETNIKALSITQQTYLNLFLITIVSYKANHPDFKKYLDLLVHFKDFTNKKSADVNYIGYKDRKSVLMHACLRGNPRSIQSLLQYKIQGLLKDPQGKSAAFYAIRNSNQENSNGILKLLLTHFPPLLYEETINGATLLNQAVEVLRFSTIQLLLKKGADINKKLKDSGNTVGHELLKHYQSNKETVTNILVLLGKQKFNFYQTNNQGINVIQRAKIQGINLQDYVSFCNLLEKDQSIIESADNDFDKISLTTFNLRTKIGDSNSQICFFQLNVQSGQVDFSEIYQPSQSITYKQSQEVQSSDQEDSELQKVADIDFKLLSLQIMTFSAAQQQKHIDMVPIAEKFLDIIDKIAKKQGLTVEVVGSFATGLWFTYSDIDVSLIPMDSTYINFESALQKIYKIFKTRKNEFDIEDIYFIKGKINTIKLSLGQKYKKLHFDISIFHRNHQNKHYVIYIIESLSVFPQIKTLFFIFKKMCQLFNLHDPQSGGLKTYALFLMISSVVKSMPTKNLGQLFYHIALYYGFYFEYNFQEYYLSNSNKLQDILNGPQMKFNFMDPFNSKNNIGGKNIKTKEMQTMFRSIYYFMNQQIATPYLPQLFELNLLFG